MTNNLDTALLDSVLVPKAQWERMRQSHDALLAAALAVLKRHPVESTSPEFNRRIQALRAAVKLAEEA